MQVTTAVKLVHGLVFFPGFRFTALTTPPIRGHRQGADRVRRLEHEPRVPDRQHYSEQIQTYAEFPLMVEDLEDEVMLYRRLMVVLMRLYEHEAREALRVKGTQWSPFHPHKIGGMKPLEADHQGRGADGLHHRLHVRGLLAPQLSPHRLGGGLFDIHALKYLGRSIMMIPRKVQRLNRADPRTRAVVRCTQRRRSGVIRSWTRGLLGSRPR